MSRCRRNNMRRATTIPCQIVRERGFRLIADRTFDLSVSGVRAPILDDVICGEPVIVSFAILGIWIDVEGRVSRVEQGRRPEDEGRAAGVVFDNLSFSSRAALAGYLHGRPQPRPRRGSPTPSLPATAPEHALTLQAVVGAWQRLVQDASRGELI